MLRDYLVYIATCDSIGHIYFSFYFFLVHLFVSLYLLFN